MADQVIDLRRHQCADCAAGHHDAENAGAVVLGERLGDERDADDDLGAGPDPGEEAENAELQRRLRHALQAVKTLKIRMLSASVRTRPI